MGKASKVRLFEELNRFRYLELNVQYSVALMGVHAVEWDFSHAMNQELSRLGIDVFSELRRVTA